MNDLRARLAEAEAALHAIRNGDVDAVVVTGRRGEQVYSLSGADSIYRQLVETMNEGAVTLSTDGVILYCNARFAEALGRPLDQVLGTALRSHMPPADQQALDAILAQARTEPSRRETNLKDSAGRLVPVYLSAARLCSEGAEMVFCLVLTDLTEQKKHEQIVAAERLASLILEQAAEAIVVCDEQGLINRASQTALQLCDGSPLLRPFAEAFPLRTAAAGPFQLAPVLRGETLRNVEAAFTRQGQKRDVLLAASPLLSGQQILGCVVILTDITERKRAEEAQRESETRLADIIFSLADWVWEVDAKGVYTYSSPKGFEILGDVIGKKPFDFMAPDDAKRAAPLFAGIAQNKAPIKDFENWNIRKTGERICFLTNAVPILDEAGDLKGYRGVDKDITSRKRGEVERRENAQRIRLLLDSTAEGLYGVDTQGNCIFVNRACLQLLGYDKEEDLLGRHIHELIHHTRPDGTPYPAAECRMYETLLHSPGTHVDDEIFWRRDGTSFPVEYWSHSMFSEGRVVGAVASFIDISERKQAEESHTRLLMAVEQSAEMIVITDKDGSILYTNPAFSKTTGYTREETVGRNPRILKSGKQNAEFYGRMWAVLRRGEVWRGHFINKRKDGTLYEEDASISPVRDTTGKIVNYVAAKRDVTREVLLEGQFRQTQKLEAVGRLAGGVAHDFNNLLMGIMGYADLCRDEIAHDHPIREHLNEITSVAQRSADITRQLLTFARKQTIEPKIFDLNDAVAGMLKLLRRLIGEDTNLAWLPGADLRLVRLDPSQFDQILVNLCLNARDSFAGVGKIIIASGNATLDADHCAGCADATPGAYVFLSVSDDGCGMGPETLAQIFEPFFTTKSIGKGSGLGLATVYGIVRQNNGFISVTSEPEKGTTFKIYLPQVAAEAAESAVIRAAENPKGHGETVLLVEDDQSLRRICLRFLKDLGYSVLEAESPEEALKLADRHPGDIRLLLTDVIMPVMDGQQLAHRIRAVRPGLKVLFMSGYTADVIVQRGALEQNVAFIAKPFTRDALARTVHDMLETAAPD